jgi:hypothetical protein
VHQERRDVVQLADNDRNMSIRVVKKGETKPPDVYQKEHEIGLLNLLVQKHPDRAREFLSRLRESMQKRQAA